MRTTIFKSFFMALVMAFAAPLFAQNLSDLGPNSTADQIAAVATQMAESGQFTADITAALVRAGVSPANATVAVREAIPSASNQQLARGLAQAGVDTAVAATAIRTANLTIPPQIISPQVTGVDPGTGAIVGADGRALSFDTPQQMLGAVASFLSNQQQFSRIQIDAIRGVAETYANTNSTIFMSLQNWLNIAASETVSPSQPSSLYMASEYLALLAQSVSDNDSEGINNTVTAINNLIASAS